MLMSRVFESRYLMSGRSKNNIIAKGRMTVSISLIIVLLRGVLVLFKLIPPYKGEHIPVEVKYSYNGHENAINIKRTFYYPQNRIIDFNSKIIIPQKELMLELSQYNIGTLFNVEINTKQMDFHYKCYVFKLGKWLIPLPLWVILGKCKAQEIALSDSEFSTEVKFIHPWFGTTYQYAGIFEIATEVSDEYER